jgi:hypothetical protein
MKRVERLSRISYLDPVSPLEGLRPPGEGPRPDLAKQARRPPHTPVVVWFSDFEWRRDESASNEGSRILQRATLKGALKGVEIARDLGRRPQCVARRGDNRPAHAGPDVV